MPLSSSSLLLRLSPKALAVFVFVLAFGGSAGALGYLYFEALRHQEDAVRVNVRQLAEMAANLVDVDKHEALVSRSQMNSDLYAEALHPLRRFHLHLPEIHYVYTMRVDEERREWFVLDTATEPQVRDMLEQLGREVEPSLLMEEYELPDRDDQDEVQAAMEAGRPYVYDFPYDDDYGTFISAQSPLFNQEGEYIGYAGVDFDLKAFQTRMGNLRRSGAITLLMAFFLSLILARLASKMRAGTIQTLNQVLEAEQQMRAEKTRAEAAVQSKSELLAVAAHDLKNPLNAIIGLTEWMLDEADEEEGSEKREHLNMILEAASHMHVSISDLLSVEELEQSGIRRSDVSIDLSALATKVVQFNQPSANKKEIPLETHIEPAVRVRGDPDRLHEALDNLLSNAVKYSPRGRRVVVRLEWCDNGRNCRFSVEDEGPGLSKTDKARLFQKFQRLASVPTGGELSTGLGLSIVKTVAEMHGGTVGCETELGKGSRFWVQLPTPTPSKTGSETAEADG